MFLKPFRRPLPILMAIFVSMMASSSKSSPIMQVHASSDVVAGSLSALRGIDLRYFVAGGTCAAFSHGITTPIDVVKTRIQADPKRYNKGMVAATTEIIKEEGPGALLIGLGPTVVGYGVEGAMKFGVYELAKPILKGLLASGGSENNEPLAYILASTIAGAVAALLLCPMESLRIKQVTDKSFADDSILTGIPKLIKQDGILNLFAGVLAMLTKQVRLTKKSIDKEEASHTHTHFFLIYCLSTHCGSHTKLCLCLYFHNYFNNRYHILLENKFPLMFWRPSFISYLENSWRLLISGWYRYRLRLVQV